jgi:hypothetical protein
MSTEELRKIVSTSYRSPNDSFMYSLSEDGTASKRSTQSGFGGSSEIFYRGTWQLENKNVIISFKEYTSVLDTWGHYGGEDHWENATPISETENFNLSFTEGSPVLSNATSSYAKC